MRRIRLSQLKGNEILAKRIFDDGGRTLLSEGVQLTLRLIQKLEGLGIQSVFIEDEFSKGIEPEDFIVEETRQKSKQAIKEMVDKYINQGRVNVDGILKSAGSIIDEVLSQKEVVINISEIRSKDESTYSHSVNVCAMSVITGTHMGYNMIRLKELAVGALLHDIGKVSLLKNAVKDKNGKLEIDMMLHPRAGYEILNRQHEISAVSKIIVLMHHERCDGTGYPLRLKRNEIHELARLVSICDKFDNLVSGNDETKTVYTYEAVEYLVAMSGQQFDTEIVQKFIENIAVYPSGSGVSLNTGHKGIVTKQNKSIPMRPVIRILYDSKGALLSEPIELDLSKEMTFFIVGVCEV